MTQDAWKTVLPKFFDVAEWRVRPAATPGFWRMQYRHASGPWSDDGEATGREIAAQFAAPSLPLPRGNFLRRARAWIEAAGITGPADLYRREDVHASLPRLAEMVCDGVGYAEPMS